MGFDLEQLLSTGFGDKMAKHAWFLFSEITGILVAQSPSTQLFGHTWTSDNQQNRSWMASRALADLDFWNFAITLAKIQWKPWNKKVDKFTMYMTYIFLYGSAYGMCKQPRCASLHHPQYRTPSEQWVFNSWQVIPPWIPLSNAQIAGNVVDREHHSLVLRCCIYYMCLCFQIKSKIRIQMALEWSTIVTSLECRRRRWYMVGEGWWLSKAFLCLIIGL